MNSRRKKNGLATRGRSCSSSVKDEKAAPKFDVRVGLFATRTRYLSSISAYESQLHKDADIGTKKSRYYRVVETQGPIQKPKRAP